MKFEVSTAANTAIFKLEHFSATENEFDAIIDAVDTKLKSGYSRITIVLSNEVLKHSSLISFLILCYRLVCDRHGEMNIIVPNEDFLQFFEYMKLSSLFNVTIEQSGANA